MGLENFGKTVVEVRRTMKSNALKQAEGGEKIVEICLKIGVSEATFFNWRKKYAGMGVSEVRDLRQLREENAKLKQLVADLSLDKHVLQELVAKKL
jgi:putative transposase